ncbi:MAG: DNA polymerase III subunit alpha [Rhodospirillaceae bacterium]|nr:DNA polymerase III subunit alpha [Rhodospirillaceae bacterium]
MPHSDFVHLTVHTAYSLAEGAIQVKNLIKNCQKNRMPAVAVTDTGNLFGALEFSVLAAKAGVQPIIGVKIDVNRNSLTSTSLRKDILDKIVLIVKNEVGYKNLLDLVSTSFTESNGSELPQISIADLEDKNDGLIAFSAGISGVIGRLILEDKKEEAEAALLDLNTIFDQRFYIEIQRHGLEEQIIAEPALLDLAYKHDVPLVATNDCYFESEDMYEAHNVLLCIAESNTITNPNRRQATKEHRFKTAEEMKKLFSDLPEAINNTTVIAKRCSFMPSTRDPILPKFVTEENKDEKSELERMALEGLRMRLNGLGAVSHSELVNREQTDSEYFERLEMELRIINQMGFPGYFLIVADFIQWSKRKGIPVGPGRGSGAGSLVAWSLQITDLDPIRWGLLFERFLNPERISMPDFDIDFCQDRRGEVIDYVQQKYGAEKVAQIITFGKLQARAVLRDVGRVLEIPYNQVDRICKMVPNNPANPMTLGEAIESESELRRLKDEDNSVRELLETGLQLEGLYRNASTHAAGVVIGDRPLKELVPLYRDPRSEMPATQFNMKWVESAGLVKFDFLGLKTLSVLQRAVELLSAREIDVDLNHIPLDDNITFEMIGKASSTGVFQLESSGMRDVLRKMRPDRFEDIIALVALYRPGPMANIPSYISRKHGEEAVDYMHPKLEPILRETYGIMIYQEQVQQAAQKLAGYTLGGADVLRRAMGKKIKSEMDNQQETFVKGAIQEGVPLDTAVSIFNTISAFAGYGFNKSHAAAYALIAYQTAYLKANYPVEFLAASMTYDMGNTDKLNIFKQELQELDIDLLPPNINKSGRDFKVEYVNNGKLAVRYALAAIKNVGGPAMSVLEEERDRDGEFSSLEDFTSRMDGRVLNKRSLENLVKAGALDKLYTDRARLFANVDKVIRYSNATFEERNSNQENLFGDVKLTESESLNFSATAEWSSLERLKYEFEAMGFYLSAHPLDAYGTTLEKVGVVSSSMIGPTVLASNGSGRINLAGIVSASRIRTNQRGNKYAFIQLSDQFGVFEVTAFSEVLSVSQHLLEPGTAVLLRCDATSEEGTIRLLANRVQALDVAVEKKVKGLLIYVNNEKIVAPLAKILSENSPGNGHVTITLQSDSQEIDVTLPDSYLINAKMRSAVKSLPGVIDVSDL